MSTLSTKEKQLRRCLQIALFFESTGKSFEPKELYEKFYPEHKEDTAKTTFKRDRDELVKHGFYFDYAEGTRLWSLRKNERLLKLPSLNDRDAAALAIAASPMLYEESFPLGFALRFALAKLTSSNLHTRLEFEDDLMVHTRLTRDKNPELQSETCADCIKAASEKRSISFDYARPGGERKRREGMVRCLHFYNGQWYLLLSKLDDLEQYTTYIISNISNLELKEPQPEIKLEPIGKSHVFPFLWEGLFDNHEERTVSLVIPKYLSAQKEALTMGLGTVRAASEADGVGLSSKDLIWTTPYRNERMLYRFILERNLSIARESVREREGLLHSLARVVKVHG